MAGTKQSKPFLNYVGGLYTEASPLNFQENMSHVEQNFILGTDGSHRRRLGLGLVMPYNSRDEPTGITNTYRWTNPNGYSTNKYVVVQYGHWLLLFSESGECGTTYKTEFKVDLNNYRVNNYKVEDWPCSFANANGVLYIAHRAIEPLKLQQDRVGICNEPSFNWGIKIINMYERDFSTKSTDNPLYHPTTLTSQQYYILRNQGWTDEYLTKYYNEVHEFPSLSEIWYLGFYTDQSTGEEKWSVAELRKAVNTTTQAAQGHFIRNVFNTCDVIDDTSIFKNVFMEGTYEKNLVFTFSEPHGYKIGDTLKLSGGMVRYFPDGFASTDDDAVPMSLTGEYPIVASHSPPAVDAIIISPTKIQLYFSELVIYRSDFTNQSYLEPTIPPFVVEKVAVVAPTSTTQAGTETTTTKINFPPLKPDCCVIAARPDVVGVYAGRVWYGSIQAGRLVNRIYYSQVLVDKDDESRFYQQNDTTSRDYNELYKTDGGYIDIPEMGTPYGLEVLKDSLNILTTDGIWVISGEGYGFFSANGYTISKITDVGVISKKSIEVIEDSVIYAASRGIYLLTTEMRVTNISEENIATLYRSIHTKSKTQIDIHFNKYDKTVHVLYSPSYGEEKDWRYCRELILDLRLKAWYQFVFPKNTIATAFVTGDSSSTNFDRVYIADEELGGNWFSLIDCDHIDFKGTPFEEVSVAYFLSSPDSVGEIMIDKKIVDFVLYTGSERGSNCKIRVRWDFACEECTGKWTEIKTGVNPTRDCGTNILYPFEAVKTKLTFGGQGRAAAIEIISDGTKPLVFYGWGILYESTTNT